MMTRRKFFDRFGKVTAGIGAGLWLPKHALKAQPGMEMLPAVASYSPISGTPPSTPTYQWKFNEGSGIYAADSIAGNTITLNNGVTWGSGYAIFTAASSQYGNASYCTTDPTSSSVSCWATPLTGQGSPYGVLLNDNSYSNFSLGVSSSGFYGYCSSNLTSGGSWSSGTQYHVAFTSDGSTASLYVNGTLIANGGGSLTNYGCKNLQTGGQTSSDRGGYYNGQLEDLRVWLNTVITQANVTYLFSQGPA